MRVCLVHNRYKHEGGEDKAFEQERELLSFRGHEVYTYEADNRHIAGITRTKLALATIWNRQVYWDLRKFLRGKCIEILHCHNTLPLISPAAYYAARAESVCVIQTLHNYRLACPAANFFRNNMVCEDCLGHIIAWPGVLHKCYRQSRAATGVVTAMLSIHWALGTWTTAVDRYIVLCEFGKSKLIAAGIPSGRISVKPNFLVNDPGAGAGGGGYALYVGRLSPEKGLSTMLDAWQTSRPRLPLVIVGDGPLSEKIRPLVGENIQWLGKQEHSQVLSLLKHADCLIQPSLCYEGSPMTVVESFAVGTPVIASDHGSLADMVDHEKTGLLFQPGNSSALAHAVDRMAGESELRKVMRVQARKTYEAVYTPARNYHLLLAIYQGALERATRQH